MGDWRKTIRLPKELHTRLVKDAGERTARTGTRASVNEVITEILGAYFVEKGTGGGTSFYVLLIYVLLIAVGDGAIVS